MGSFNWMDLLRPFFGSKILLGILQCFFWSRNVLPDNFKLYLAKLEYFTNLDIPEIFGVTFPGTKTLPLGGPGPVAS